jgi:hypothetical protein
MKGRLRTVATLGALAALALLLSGCIKLTMDLQVNSNDTVSGTVQLGVAKELLELSGGSIEDILGSEAPFPSDAPGVTVEEFDDGEFAGQQFNFDSVPITQFQDQGAEALSITRQGDTYVVSGVLDMSGGVTGATGLGVTGQELLESAEIRLTMTFPGDVVEATGTIDGNTVTWEPVFGERLEISATASAIDDGDAAAAPGADGDSSILMYVLIGVGVLVVVAIVLFLLRRSRRAAPPAAGGGDSGFGAPAPTPAAPMAPGTGEAPPAPPTPPAPPPPPAG